MRSTVILSISLIIVKAMCCQSASEANDVFRDTYASWANLHMEEDNSPDVCQCQDLGEKSSLWSENDVALMYFKKFVNLLFSRKKLHYDAISGVYKRSMLFTLLPAEIEKLQAAQDPRDLDVLLTKIMEGVHPAPLSAGEAGCDYLNWGLKARALVIDIFKDIKQLLKKSEVRFILILLTAFLIGWHVHRRYRYGVISVMLGGCFLYGFLITYLDCNRKLEVTEMLDVIEKTQPAEKSWFTSIKNLFNYETKQAQIIRLSKLSIPFCRPDHVLVIYINDLLIKNLEMFLEKITNMVMNFNSGLIFPLNYVAKVVYVFVVVYILKLLFKYILSPKAWSYCWRSRNKSLPATIQHESLNATANIDRLSGENLTMLLNVLSATNNVQQQPSQLCDVSGVQDMTESPSKNTTDNMLTGKEKSNDSSSSNSSNISISQTARLNLISADSTILDRSDESDKSEAM